MKVALPFETSVTIYQSKRRHITQDLNLHEHRCENLRYSITLIYSHKAYLNLQYRQVSIVAMSDNH
jgi:hypothetical protein